MKLGIDIGTSYSSVTAEIEGKLEVIKLSTGASAFGDSYSIPTAVYIGDGEVLLGQAAFNKRMLDPSRFKSEFKRDFGTNTPYIIGGGEYLPEQLYTEMLLYFKDQAVQQKREEIEEVCITHPANYGNNKKMLLKKAAENAGIFNVKFADEPTAAAAGYSYKNKIENGDILLVYDLGGGTFDTALIKKTADGYVHLTEPLGISQCGGMDFDRVIFDDIVRKMSESNRFDVSYILNEKRFIAGLSETCVQIKHQLSQAQTHTQPIPVGFEYFEYTITREEFEDLIAPIIKRTCEKVRDLIYNAGLMPSDIDRALLVGGSSRVPLVRKMIGDILEDQIALDADPELIICQGAAVLSFAQKQEQDKNRIEEEEKARLEQERLLEMQKQLEQEKQRLRDEQLKMEAAKKQEQEQQSRKAAQADANVNQVSNKKAMLCFKMRGYSDFIKETTPFALKGMKFVVKIDDDYEFVIPPNPTRYVQIDSGEHQIYIYRQSMGIKTCKTLQKINLKENEKYEIEIKSPAFNWDNFKLYHNNKILK